jgi:DNA modification methylase
MKWLDKAEKQRLTERQLRHAIKIARQTERNRELAKRYKPDEACRLFISDISDLTKHIPKESIDLIVADPPYSSQYLNLYPVLGKVAHKLLRPDGVLACMSGLAYLPSILAHLEKYLTYRWTISYQMPGQSTKIFERKILNQWKPILLFTNGGYGNEWLVDVLKSDGREKEHHDWGQNSDAVKELVNRLSRPGDLICDPFLGGGTTAVAAISSKRRFIGSDIDRSCIRTTKARLHDLQQ